MQIIRNVGYVNQRRRRARLSALFGFIALVGTFPLAFVMSGNPQFVFVTYILLVLGFVLFNRGMQGMGRWSNNQRHVREDVALDEHLSDFSNRSTMIHYGSPNGKDTFAHALVTTGGVMSITTSDFPGNAKVVDDRWSKGGSMLAKVFSFTGPQIGNPTKEADRNFTLIESALQEAGQDVDVYSVIVFTSPTAAIEVEEASHPVLYVKDLEHYVRQIEPDTLFSNSDREDVVRALGQGESIEVPEKTPTRRPVKMKKRVAS